MKKDILGSGKESASLSDIRGIDCQGPNEVVQCSYGLDDFHPLRIACPVLPLPMPQQYHSGNVNVDNMPEVETACRL